MSYSIFATSDNCLLKSCFLMEICSTFYIFKKTNMSTCRAWQLNATSGWQGDHFRLKPLSQKKQKATSCVAHWVATFDRSTRAIGQVYFILRCSYFCSDFVLLIWWFTGIQIFEMSSMLFFGGAPTNFGYVERGWWWMSCNWPAYLRTSCWDGFSSASEVCD